MPIRRPPARLERFLHAQERDYAQALAELTAGKKESHWIWYVLPQLKALGRSHMAREYGIESIAEAREYVAHPVLGPRLVQCVATLLRHADQTPSEILGEVDAMKFRSCLTLFAAAAPGEPAFKQALLAFYAGQPDGETLRLINLPQGEA